MGDKDCDALDPFGTDSVLVSLFGAGSSWRFNMSSLQPYSIDVTASSKGSLESRPAQ